MDETAHEMYKEHILDHYQHPHNFGKLEGATHAHREFNPLCGDDLTIELIIKNGKVETVKFHGRGCAISMASASLLTDHIKQMTHNEIMSLGREDVLKLLHIPVGPVRLKCALLPLETLHKTLHKTLHTTFDTNKR